MNKKKSFIMTFLLAAVTTLMAYLYISNATAQAVPVPKVETTEVVTVISTIPAHVKVSEEMLEMKEVPVDAVHPQAIKTTAEAIGAMTKTELIAGEQILVERLVLTETDSALSYRIPESMRAITIPANETMGVAGYVVAGDHVDMLVAYTTEEETQGVVQQDDEEASDEETEKREKTTVYTQMQNLEILAVGPRVTTEGVVGLPSSFTLLVTPEQAEVIVFANQMGVMHMTLRNPADAVDEDLNGYGEDNFDDWKER